MHILGAGGHAKVVMDICEALENKVTHIWDDDINASLKGIKVSGTIFDFFNNSLKEVALIAIGNNSFRRQLVNQYNYENFIKISHPSAVLSSTAIIDIGTVVMPNVTINADVKIGKHCIINTSASVDHDCILEDFVHIAPNVGLAGGVSIGEGSYIGIGTSIIQNVKIGKWTTVGAGTVVIQHIPDYAVVVGNPGKIIKYNNLISEK